ncbi:MAG: glycosyltransferase family 4 protein [Candidatus Hodarchaeota archaeon]
MNQSAPQNLRVMPENFLEKRNLNNSPINLIFIAQGPEPKTSQYVSGAAVRQLEIMKRISRKQNVILWVISIKPVCDNFQKNDVKAYYKIVPRLIKSEKFFVAHIIDSIIRSIYVCLAPTHIQNDNILIHSPSDFLWDTFPAFVKKLRNKEIKWFASVYHIVLHPSQRPGGFSLSNLFSYIAQHMSLVLVVRLADMIQTETNFLRNELVRRYRISPKKIFVCQSGVNPKVIDNFSWTKGKIYDACFLAHLHRSKGIHDLIDTWEYLCESKKDAKLAIAGDGPIKVINEVKNRIKDLDLENNVFFLGFLSEKEKFELLKASKIYVLPSSEEGIPITFYEAMYCGLPVITYYLPTYAEIKDYIVSVPLGDVEGLADEILKVLEDEDLARRLGDKGRKLAKEHTWDETADYIISQIEKKIVASSFG